MTQVTFQIPESIAVFLDRFSAYNEKSKSAMFESLLLKGAKVIAWQSRYERVGEVKQAQIVTELQLAQIKITTRKAHPAKLEIQGTWSNGTELVEGIYRQDRKVMTFTLDAKLVRYMREHAQDGSGLSVGIIANLLLNTGLALTAYEDNPARPEIESTIDQISKSVIKLMDVNGRMEIFLIPNPEKDYTQTIITKKVSREKLPGSPAHNEAYIPKRLLT